MVMRSSLRLFFSVLIALSASAAGAEKERPSAAVTRKRVELIPTDRVAWRASKLFAPVTGLFLGGPDYWYGERTIEIDTKPSGAMLELAYVRENIQKRFERAQAPILLVLPSRIEAGRSDSVEIRALLDGHRRAERKLEVRSRETELEIELAPLPNLLRGVSHRYFARRGLLGFLTEEALAFRVHEMSDGFSIALLETGKSPDAAAMMAGISSPNIESLRAESLGEDLVLRVKLHESVVGNLELRTTQGYDSVRELHRLSIHLVPSLEGASSGNRVRDALANIDREDVFGCALEFDRSMRSQLDPAALARALVPASSFVDPYLRAALKRLGEISPKGVIEITDGSTFSPSIPIELSAAGIRSAEALGLLALLREFVAELESPSHRVSTLKGLIAPEQSRERFDIVLEKAESLEQRCDEEHP